MASNFPLTDKENLLNLNSLSLLNVNTCGCIKEWTADALYTASFVSLKRILVVSFIFPFPPNSGGGRDIYERVKTLTSNGYTVDLIATPREMPSAEDVDSMQSLVDKIWIAPRTRNPSALLSFKPFHYKTRSSVKAVPLNETYDVVLLESEFVGGILENPRLRARHRVLRVHNDEASLHLSLARDATSLAARISFFAESWKFRRYSPQIMKQFDQLWYISHQEMELAGTTSWASRSHHVPVLVDQARFRRPALTSARVFYVGALSIPINSQGLIWYLKNVHPQLLSIPDYEFVLAGRTGPSGLEHLLEVIQASKRVTYIPNPDDLAPLYDSAAAFVNPIQHGAGVKVKTLDAIIAGLPVISTSVGVEGTDLVDGIHAVIADTSEDFARGVREILEDKQRAGALVNAAQQLLAENNGPDTMCRLLERLT